MGATPKPPGQRRRTNLGQAQWHQLPGRGREGEPPQLPANPLGRRQWKLETEDWWRRIWASPMAVMWEESEVPTLVRLARLMDLSIRGEASAAELAAITALEDRYGLSPLARRRLQWEIDRAMADATGPDLVVPPSQDPRARRMRERDDA